MNILKELKKVNRKIRLKEATAELAEDLFKKGYEPVPIKPGFKFPKGFDKWQEKKLPWEPWPDGYGIGLRCGHLIGIDIDIYNKKIVQALLNCFKELSIIIRVGEMPKVLVPVYCPEVPKKIMSDSWKKDPDDESETKSKIEILSKGQQFVAYAIHPDTDKPYRWSGDLLTHEPPTVTLEFIENLFAKFYELAEQAGWEQDISKNVKGKGKKATGKPSLATVMNGVSKGGRNDAAAQVAGHYFYEGKTHVEALDLCREWNVKNRPSLGDEELSTVVNSIHRLHSENTDKANRGFKPLDIEEWYEEVDGEELLAEIYATFKCYHYMSNEMRMACSLWVMLTYCYNAFRILPMLGITSPDRRCGKTTLASIICGMVYHGLMASNLTSAVTYRIIEKHLPTLIVDEMDTFLPDNPELRGIFNSGHTKSAAFVWRCAPKTNDPEMFPTWAPKVLLMIGSLPSTMEDRSIPIQLDRKPVKENIKPLSVDYEEKVTDIRSKCYRWAKDNFEALKKTRPDVTLKNSDRAIDNWIPLIAIAELLGAGVLKKATKAMIKVESRKLDEKSIAAMVLEDLVERFLEGDSKFIKSDDLVRNLNYSEDRPWADWNNGKGITQHKLAALLKPYHIVPIRKTIDGSQVRGYSKLPIVTAYERYK